MPRTPDAAFIERCTKLHDTIETATGQQVEQLVLDARRFGDNSAEMAHALGTKGRMARWSQEDLAAGADALDRAIGLAETHALGADICTRWLRTLAFVRDDLGHAQPAIFAAEKARALTAPPAGDRMHPETIAAIAGLVHTMRTAIHPVLPELRELAKIWPSMGEGSRKVQLEVLQRFIQRRKDLSPAEIEWLKKITAEPQGVQATLPRTAEQIATSKEIAMPRTPDAAFIERYTKLYDAIDSATDQQVEQLVLDARRFGEDSAEMAYALGTKGRLALWSQKELAAGADALERAIGLAETHALAPEIRVRWLRNLSFVRDDLGQAQPAIAAAEKANALTARLSAEVIANTAGLVHTMRIAIHPVLPELRELAKIWPSMGEGWRKSELQVLQRFIQRRKDLSPAEIECLKKITVEPQGVQAVLPPPEAKADPAELAKVLAELDTLIGLREAKAEFHKLASVLQVEEMRRAAKLTVAPRSNHCVFLGPPGTGKTTVARLLGRLFKSLGLLARGQVIEVDRSGLVAGYIGQTAIKTAQTVDSALDGVLFVDEAYSLFNPSGNDFGHEAVATLLKRMEDDRARLVVVFAGYDEPMLRMLEMNPGLKSRVNTTLHFRTYGAQELTSIFMQQSERAGYKPTEQAVARVREMCALMKGSEDPATFGNAREIRNLFEDTVAQQAHRLVARAGRGKKPTPDELQRIDAADVHWEFLGDDSLRDTLIGEPLRTVAVHEMGHALVGHLVDGPPPVLVTTIPSSHALGRTFFAETASPVFTRAQLLGRAARALGGRAAEEVMFGVLTSGAAHDLVVAERIALELLRTGMSEETTHEALEEYAATADDGRVGSGWRGERTRQEIGELLQEAYALALKIVREQEPALRLAADRLVERRTLNGDELGILFGPRPGKGAGLAV